MARFDLFLLSAFALALEGNVLVLFPAPLDDDNAASVLDTARLVLFPAPLDDDNTASVLDTARPCDIVRSAIEGARAETRRRIGAEVSFGSTNLCPAAVATTDGVAAPKAWPQKPPGTRRAARARRPRRSARSHCGAS